MESALDKVLRLAAPDLVAPADVGLDDHDDIDDAVYEHLMHECPWFESVSNGEAPSDMELTPHTPEASTVDQPTVPPGGPGLFHHKGLHLPPYIQHLYKHLVARYGKHEAYGVAVGIVKKWAAGINPGGFKTKSGKGKRTHPDVRAAAQKNVAEWEKDRTMGGNKGGEVKASARMTGPQANFRKADEDGPTCHTCSNRDGSGCALVAVTVDRTTVCDSYQGAAQLAAPADWPSGKAYAKSFLSPPGGGEIKYGMLKQEPSQTVSPSPPLPPKVDLPSPKEMRAFAVQLSKMEDDDENHHLAAAQMHLESAAEKMDNNPISALASLRSAQMAIQNEWRERIQRNVPRIAYVFSANTPPAEQSSQRQAGAKAQAEIGQMQGAAQRIAQMIDRVRRSYFGRMGMDNHTAGGGMAGQPNARMLWHATTSGGPRAGVRSMCAAISQRLSGRRVSGTG